MNKPGYMKTFVCSMGLLGASSGWALTPQLPQILYGTSTTVSSSNQFALAATPPEGNDPRSHYVVIAEVDDANHLKVLAWQDTTASLELLSRVGLAKYSGVVTVVLIAAGFYAKEEKDEVKCPALEIDQLREIGRPTATTLRRTRRRSPIPMAPSPATSTT